MKKSTNPVAKIAGVAITVIAALVLSNTGYAAVADFDSAAHGEKLYKRPSDKERKDLNKDKNNKPSVKAPASTPKPTPSTKPTKAPASTPKPTPTTKSTKAPASTPKSTSTTQSTKASASQFKPTPSTKPTKAPIPKSTSSSRPSQVTATQSSESPASRRADMQSDISLNPSPTPVNIPSLGGEPTPSPSLVDVTSSSVASESSSSTSSTSTSTSIDLDSTPAPGEGSGTPDKQPTQTPKVIVPDALMGQIRQAFTSGERGLLVRSQQYLDELAEAFRSIYNRLEDQGALLDTKDSGLVGERIPDFPIEQGTVDGQTVLSAFRNYPIVRGVAASNPEIAALSMRIKVERKVSGGWFSVALEACGPDFFQITMFNNSASASQWITVVNPNGKDTNAVKKCLNLNSMETVFRSVSNEVHLAQTHTAAMIEAIILMIVEGEANGAGYRLTLVDNSKEDSKDDVPSLKALLLKEKAPSAENGKEITEADFLIINN